MLGGTVAPKSCPENVVMPAAVMPRTAMTVPTPGEAPMLFVDAQMVSLPAAIFDMNAHRVWLDPPWLL